MSRKLSRHIRRSIATLQASGYSAISAKLGGFEIIGISSTDLVLVHVAGTWPVRPWTVDALRQVPAPANCKRLVHYWPLRATMPQVIVL